MSASSSVGVALAATAVLQAVLALWLDRTPITGAAYRKVVEDGTRNHDIDGIAAFFHDPQVGAARVDEVVRIGSLASRVTTQVSALTTSLASGLVLIGVATFGHHGAGWITVTTATTLGSFGALATLANLIRKGSLRDFRIRGASRRDAWKTPGPYVLVVLAASLVGAIAGFKFS